MPDLSMNKRRAIRMEKAFPGPNVPAKLPMIVHKRFSFSGFTVSQQVVRFCCLLFSFDQLKLPVFEKHGIAFSTYANIGQFQFSQAKVERLQFYFTVR